MDYFNHIQFAYPQFFWLLLLIPAMLLWQWKVMAGKKVSLMIPTHQGFKNYQATLRQKLSFLPLLFRILTVAAIIIALARPQSSSKAQQVTTEGISIVLAMDISGSMLAEDFKPNRIEAAKKVALDFIDQRPNDLIGLVIFSGESFTQCPITTDHAVLKNMMSKIESGMLTDGTAIGEGLATAVSRLKDAKTKSKVIILLTDGVNNAGAIAPLTAGEIAKTFGIRVYTIGVGTQGMAPYPFKTPFGIQYQNMEVQIDEAICKQISDATDGKYFRATNNKKLKEIYDEIDKLEKTKIEVTEFRRHSEEFFPFALAAGIFLILEMLLRYTWMRRVP
jgi:Ca-activated chloride channel family protein